MIERGQNPLAVIHEHLLCCMDVIYAALRQKEMAEDALIWNFLQFDHILADMRIFVSEGFQKTYDLFSSLTGIQIAFDGVELGSMPRKGLNLPPSEFCILLRKELGWQSRCFEQDKRKLKEAEQTRARICYQCHAGLTESIIPVISDNRILGYAWLGQFRTQKDIASHVATAWERKFGNDAIRKSFRKLPHVAPAELEKLLDMFSLFVDYIIQKHFIEVKGDRLVECIMAHMRENVSKPYPLSKAVGLTGKSPSMISHAFRQILGKTFKQVSIETKLAEAERLFRNDPGLSVKECAQKAGMNDPLYFSKVFKKYRGIAPSEFKTAFC